MKTGQCNGWSKNKTKLFDNALVRQQRVALLDLEISKALKEKKSLIHLLTVKQTEPIFWLTEQFSCKKKVRMWERKVSLKEI